LRLARGVLKTAAAETIFLCTGASGPKQASGTSHYARMASLMLESVMIEVARRPNRRSRA
jgi:hypothetical protein